MPWDPRLDTGLVDLDVQHQYFIEVLDHLDRSVRRQDERETTAILTELARYARYHFASEEALMSAYGYPGGAHRREHLELLKRVESMLNETPRRPEWFLFFLKWLIAHIQISDTELAEFVLTKRGELRSVLAQP